jgi:NifU-like protein involved in Fe-S cluster formation
MEALLLNILNEYHAQEEAFTVYNTMVTNKMVEEEVETKKRFLQLMKGKRILQSHQEEEAWKAFTAYRKQNEEIKLKKEQKRAKKVQAWKDRQDEAARINSSVLTTQKIVSIDDA